FAWDSYRRFVQMYGDVVLGLKPQSKDEEDPFEVIIKAKKAEKGVKNDTELTTEDLKDLVVKFKAAVKQRKGMDFPEDPKEQLWGAINAVFGSWMGNRAIIYRRINKIPEDWGTAVNVQAMVFGNMGEDSATGVAFTRDPATGEKVFYGEFLINAQGEDVVSGVRTPSPIAELAKTQKAAYEQLEDIRAKLEKHYKDMQDIEFTIERNRLFMLQTRNGKRTAQAAVRIAVDMVKEKLITKEAAVARIDPDQLDQLLHPMFDPAAKKKATVLAKGLNASPGAAVGKVYFNAEDAEAAAGRGEKVILVRLETSPEDIGGMAASQGILTVHGGKTSHAAVVGRGMGKPCVVGCGALSVSYTERRFNVTVGGQTITVKEGDVISIDGSDGSVMLGAVPTKDPEITGDFSMLMKWVDEIRTMGVRTNADTPHDAKVALDFGAEGIGLCRTEHMFFGGDRIDAVREMILADDLAGREKALAKILPMQQEDFVGIFRVMNGLPVTIRTLDPPLHEFLPNTDDQIEELAYKINRNPMRIREKLHQLHELNPMLGHRGCRLGMVYPEITAMQARAIMQAACQVKAEGIDVHPEIMIPLVGTMGEMTNQKDLVVKVAKQVMKETGVTVNYMVGTMIEVPRAAIIADKIAKEAEFFSFGTNDLTQMTFGYSRDDAGKFLPFYIENKVWIDDPFQSLDQEGVGKLVEMGVKLGRKGRKNLKIGICGEHGGDPASVQFCFRVGMNYVSCSPFRVPIARLAAAQAALAAKDASTAGASKSTM
ncbi:MAG TPA: pyruvate, phosphate dikinase, partial [Candidatus Latescibacteria bacterium]|nr:pyruvate, phosphate dikinase [Candidatus Latescibacterota bacterium]